MTTLDQARIDAFGDQVVADAGATLGAIGVVIGDRLGLWKAMARSGAVTAADLAARTATHPRYVREWLGAQAAAGYVTYDPGSGRYALPAEHAAVLADEDGSAFLAGLFEVAAACWAAADKTTQGFRTGHGIAWGHQHPCLFQGAERFTRARYRAHLVSAWIPALEGVLPRLHAGARVADVGCGAGAATILLAQAFPASRFFGFDAHAGSIELAEKRAQAAGVGDRVTFAVADATRYPGDGYDLVAHFDCLHELPDPEAAARQVRRTLAEGGAWMIVEPLSGDRPEESHTPVGRLYYAASTVLCVPHALATGGAALGAQAGPARLGAVAEAGGFSRVRRVAETPFHLVLEARP